MAIGRMHALIVFFSYFIPLVTYSCSLRSSQIHCLHGNLLGSDTKIWWCGQGGGRVFACWQRCLINYINTIALGTSLVAQMVKNLPALQETWVWLLGGEDPLEKEMATHSSSHYLENSMDRGAWWATVHGVTKSQNDWVPNTFTHTYTHTHTRIHTHITSTLEHNFMMCSPDPIWKILCLLLILYSSFDFYLLFRNKCYQFFSFTLHRFLVSYSKFQKMRLCRFLLQGIFPTQESNPGIEPRSPGLEADALTSEPPVWRTVNVQNSSC